MSQNDETSRACTVLADESVVYTHGSTRDYYAVTWIRNSLHLSAIGEPTGADLIIVLQEAMQSAPIAACRQTLIDLTQFHGVMDWQAVRLARSIMGWEKEGHKVAYVVANDEMINWTKPLGPTFERTVVAVFRERKQAQAWLDNP